MATIHSTARAARLLIGLTALVAGCKHEPSPLPAPAATAPAVTAPAITKLDGAPARVIWTRFAPDGASVLVLENRALKEEGAKGAGLFAVSRRPVAGGVAKDLIAADALVLGLAPLGDGIVALQRPPTADEKGEPRDPDEDRYKRYEELVSALEKSALYRVGDDGAALRVSPDGRRCVHLVGAAGGQWVAFSLAPDEKRPLFRRLDPGGEETHVLGAKPGEEITLTYKGLVRDLSPDGARVLVRRAPKVPAGGETRMRWEIPPPRDDAQGLVLITVKDQTVTELPTKLQVDGASVDVSAFLVGFAGEGLLFKSAQGELYRSALDGSSATRLAGPQRDADAGAPDGGGASADAGPPPERERRVLGPKGTLFELREEAGVVVLSSLATPGAPEPLARFEGPLSALGEVAFDAAEKRVAIAVLSDTSRDGLFDVMHDDAEIFFTAEIPGAAAGALAFGRAEVGLLAGEIRPKLAVAAGVPESAITIVPWHGSVQATAELPWNDGEDAKALLARLLVAARALSGALPQKTREKISIHVRVGQLDLTLYDIKEGGAPRHFLLAGQGIAMSDPQALLLVHKKPASLSSWNVSTLSGELVNTGTEPTPPIEVYSVTTSGYDDKRKRVEVVKPLGSIAPGQSVKYSFTATDFNYGDEPHASFRAEGKRLAVFNEYSYEHTLDALTTALAVRARLGVWVEHGEGHDDALVFVVRLTAEQAALADAARATLFHEVTGALLEHQRKFHKGASAGNRLLFAAPGTGGWKLAVGKKIERYEGSVEAQLKERF